MKRGRPKGRTTGEARGRSRRLCVAMPDDDLDAVREDAKRLGLGIGEYVREAIREHRAYLAIRDSARMEWP